MKILTFHYIYSPLVSFIGVILLRHLDGEIYASSVAAWNYRIVNNGGKEILEVIPALLDQVH